MNKELIKKYKKEFDHWLDGGTLLARRWVIDGNDGDTSYTLWYKVDSEHWEAEKIFNTSLEYDKTQIVLNDEYIEFRKALAEGKTVQYNPITQYNNRWDDIPSINPNVHDTIKNYRIKPDEPKFKVGDWVTSLSGETKVITEVSEEGKILHSNSFMCYASDCIHRQPQEGEQTIHLYLQTILTLQEDNEKTY